MHSNPDNAELIPGPTEREASERLCTVGCNALPGTRRRGPGSIAMATGVASVAWFEVFQRFGRLA